MHWWCKVGVVESGNGCGSSIGARRENAKRCRGGVIVRIFIAVYK